MYFIVDKTTREVLHINPAPLKQALTPIEIWALYDSELHDACKIAGQIRDESDNVIAVGGELPEFYNLSADNPSLATIWTREQMSAGLFITAPVGKKYLGDDLINKTRAEKIEDGELTIDDVRAEKASDVNTYYNELIGRGCIHDGKIFSCSNKVRQWLLGQKTVTRDPGWFLNWYTGDKKSEMILDESNLDAFLKALADHYRSISAVKEQQIMMIARAASITELDSNNWTASWILPDTLPPE